MIVTYFGNPGCGKTTLAVKYAIKRSKKYDNCYLNFDHTVPGAAVCKLRDLGKWTFPDHSYIAIDEAGIEYNSRKFNSLQQCTIAWMKKHRHYRCDLDIFSQSWDDMDITLRRLSDQLWHLRKIGPFTLARRIYKYVAIDEDTHQIIDGYRMANPFWLLIWFLQLDNGLFLPKFKLTFRPFYYRYFDSFSKDDIPVKEFPRNPSKPLDKPQGK